MNNMNIAEILKDCPSGMELDCTCADNVVFDKVIEYDQIKCVIGESRTALILDKYGQLQNICCPKCVIFPKENRDWSTFQRPFKNGDIVANDNDTIGIVKSVIDDVTIFTHFAIYDGRPTLTKFPYSFNRLATEKEKQKLFDVIKENGYKWNEETKALEKLIVPKFKVGDKIESYGYRYIITEIKDDYYLTKCGNKIRIENQDKYNLLPYKFDINTLKPFDRVLVNNKQQHNRNWRAAHYSHYDTQAKMFYADGFWERCIPYEGNEYLLGTANDCDEYYKTW